MAVHHQLIDLFPQNLSNGLFPISRMQDWDPRVSLHEWIQLNPEAFVTYIPPGDARVFFVSVAVKETHLTRLLTSARSTANVLPDRLISFEKVGARLLKDPNNARRKTSVKTIYRCDHNIFVVSKWFTFGLSVVATGEQHVYTANAPILLFNMPSSAPLPGKNPPNIQRRAFCPRDFPYFTEYVMRPDTSYSVPPGTRYLVVTLKKCYLTVYKVAADALIEGSIPFNSHRTHEDAIYTVPPLSPRSPGLVRPEDRLQRSAAKRTRRRSPERELPGCSSWPSPMEINEPRPDNVAGTTAEVPPPTVFPLPRPLEDPVSRMCSLSPRRGRLTSPPGDDDISPLATPDISPLATPDISPLATPGITSLTDTSSRCIVAPLPAPRLWRRTQHHGTVAQAHATVFPHRTYLWEDDDAPGMGPTLRAAMSCEAPVNLALDLSHVDVPMDLSRPCSSRHPTMP
ncbi:hypothetical protein JTE90_020611 [Oedothorax gibbosus]|uniref:Uncharacterized protein n=1 Tax=Oedothorax gibbosus TaxID=931172 RepID=A0AAV6TT76_9ARAC|nr:hypothetical protein JTE90_020611 [Oedothorax gibbosus]